MSTNLSIAAGLATVNTNFVVGWQDFMMAAMPGVYQEYTEVIKTDTRTTELHMLANFPVMEELQGARVDKALRHYSQSMKFVTFYAQMPVKRYDLAYDKIGLVQRAINQFFGQQKSAYDSLANTKWVSNSDAGPTCYDGQYLFSASHPHGAAGATQSNLSTSTSLSHTNLVAVERAMSLLRYENGEPMNITPSHIEVGPYLKVRLAELLSADRVQTATAASVYDAGASAVAAGTRSSYWNGKLTAIVNPRHDGYDWTVMDLTKPGVRPLILQEARFPEPVIVDEMTADRRMSHDEFVYSIEGDYQIHAGMWAVAHRATASS